VEEGVRGGWVTDRERLDRPRAGAQEGIAELRAFPEEELVARHDVLAEEARRYFPIDREESMRYQELSQVYLTELTRRETARQGERMERLTRSIKWLIWVITGATIIGVILTACSVLSSG
jgi:hypothetical protein